MTERILKWVFVAELFLAIIIRERETRPYRREQRRRNPFPRQGVSTVEWYLMIVYPVALIVLPVVWLLKPWLSFANYRLNPRSRLVAGLLGMVAYGAGNWLLWRSHADLGRNWSPTVERVPEQVLVTTGVYRYIRHPMYLAHVFLGIGQALLVANWLAGLANLAIFIPVYMLRVPREEQALIEQFGDAYHGYAMRTGRLVPVVCRAARISPHH